MALQLHWKFDEVSGTTAADSSGNSRSGTVNGTTFASSAVTGAGGTLGGAILLDGTNDYISRSATAFNGYTNFSFALWTKKTTSGFTTSDIHGFSAGVWGGAGSVFFEPHEVWPGSGSGGGTAFRFDNTWFSYSDPSWTTSDWHHFAITYDGTNIKIYRDAVLKYTSGTLSGKSLSLSGWDLHVGAMVGFGRYYPGSIDDFRIYDHALTLSEVTALKDLANSAVPSGSSVIGHSYAITSIGQRIANGSVANAISLAVSALGKRNPGGVAANGLSLDEVAQGRKVTSGLAVNGVSLDLSAAGRRITNGLASLGQSLAITGQGQTTTSGAAAISSHSLAINGTGYRQSRGSASVGLSVSQVVAALTSRGGYASLNLGLGVVSVGIAPAAGVIPSGYTVLDFRVNEAGTGYKVSRGSAVNGLRLGNQATAGSVVITLIGDHEDERDRLLGLLRQETGETGHKTLLGQAALLDLFVKLIKEAGVEGNIYRDGDLVGVVKMLKGRRNTTRLSPDGGYFSVMEDDFIVRIDELGDLWPIERFDRIEWVDGLEKLHKHIVGVDGTERVWDAVDQHGKLARVHTTEDSDP